MWLEGGTGRGLGLRGVDRGQIRRGRGERFTFHSRCSGKPLRESKQGREMRMNHDAGPE